MSDLVLRVPASVSLAEVLAGDPDLLSRRDDWERVAVRLDGGTYIALRTDWLPPKAALQESDGARVLLVDRCPAEVQAAFDARQFARTGPALLDKLWKRLCDETKSEAPEVAPERVAEVVEQVRDILVAHPPELVETPGSKESETDEMGGVVRGGSHQENDGSNGGGAASVESAPIIPEQLKGCRFILVKHKDKSAIEKGWQTTANYAYDDPRLLAHIAAGGNYGVMPDGGVCILDADKTDRLMEMGVLDRLLETLVVRTGRKDGFGSHFYVRCPDAPAEKHILRDPEIREDLGDLRGSGHPSFCVGPGSIHPSGGRYEIANDAPLLEIPWAELQALVVDPCTPPQREITVPRIPRTPRSITISDALELRVTDFLMPQNPTVRDTGEIEGVHPVHGSETGTNLTISANNQEWWCRRHQTGGGPLEALAVAEGIIECADACPGCLQGHWPAVFDALEARGYGEQLKEWEWERGKREVPAPVTGKAVEPAPVEVPEVKVLRPTIVLTNRHMHEVTADTVRAIAEANDPPRLFHRAAALVRVCRDEQERPLIQTLSEHALRGVMDRVAVWLSVKEGKDGAIREIPEYPPVSIVRDVLGRPTDEWRLPPLAGIATSPILHLDGTIHGVEGYDPVTLMYFMPEPGFVLAPVPANPTAADIAAAKEMILEMFLDFPFIDEPSRWNAVGAFLTGVFRPIISGPCPCWLLTKPQAGSGASLMQNAVYLAITGVTPPASVTPKTKEEWGKRIMSILRGGAPVHIWDNLEGQFKSDILASLLTAREWSDRILGVTEDAALPARTVWFANGNNVQIGGDLARRVLMSRIDAETAMPWLREDFRHPDLLRWVRENRGRLIAAALTLGVAWVRAGCPEPERMPPLGGYEGWRHVVGGILEHAGGTELLGNAMDVFLEGDTDLRQWEGFLSAVFDEFGSHPWTVSDLKTRLDREVKEVTAFRTLVHETLPDDLSDAFVDPHRSFARVCGRALARQEGRRFPSGLMIRRGKTVQRATQWVIIQTKGSDQASLEGGEET